MLAAQTLPRVLIFGSFAPGNALSGLDVALDNLVKSTLRERYEPRVVSVYRSDGWSRGLIRRMAYGFVLFVRSVRLLKASKCALADVHAVSGRDLLKAGAILAAARVTRTPVALRIHGGNFERAYLEASAVERWIVRALLRLPNRVVLLSRGWEAIVRNIEPAARTCVVPNSIDSAALAATASRRPPRSEIVLMLGGFCERKGHFDAVEAAAAVSASHPQVRFRFFGSERDPGASSALRSSIGLRGLEAIVSMHDPVFGEEKLATIGEASILILPSHTENMPMAVMEAMAAGMAVVASRTGAVPEMIADGETGILVEPRQPAQLASAIAQLLDDPHRRQAMGMRAATAARALWDMAVVGRQTAALYDSIIRRS
jgi:glycosyltransferase involved in cell wall biosynthesis